MRNITENASLSYLNSVLTDIECPICKSNIGKLLYTVNADEAAQHFVLKEVDFERNRALAKHIGFLWKQDTCDVVSCDGCGFIFSKPYVGGDADFYTLAYQRTGYPKWKWEYQQTLETITNIASKNGQIDLRLLEIGAGDGAFVKRISPAIVPKENILCLEYSEYGCKQIEE